MWVAGRKPILIPARTLKVIEATSKPPPRDHPYSALVEESCSFTGPRGFAVGRAIVKVKEDGRIPIRWQILVKKIVISCQGD